MVITRYEKEKRKYRSGERGEGEGKREEDVGDEHVIDDKGGAGDGWVSAAGQG